MTFQKYTSAIALAGLIFAAQPGKLSAASHREAPITALDTKADITDWYTFIDPERPDRVVMVMNVDPFLEPSNGPNYFPFDPNVQYDLRVDNNRDGVADVTFQVRFKTEIRGPGVFTGFVGGIAGIPQITSLDGKGSEGFSLRQNYTVTMVKGNDKGVDIADGKTLFAVPSNVGPRTMPDYTKLRAQGIYNLSNGISVFAGTVADPFFIDLGAAFDSLNFRAAAGGGVMAVRNDLDDTLNNAPNSLAGFNVNSIVISVPIRMLTEDGKTHTAAEKQAVIGTYGATLRQNVTVLKKGNGTPDSNGPFVQIQRMGNPLINELLIGTDMKDKFSMGDPADDSQFAPLLLDPLLAKVFQSIGIPTPSAPRLDLLPLVQYAAPICPGCGPKDAGPVADLLRINLGIPSTPVWSSKRLGVLAGDFGGFPNGRRLNDDVVDIASRVVSGALADRQYNVRIGDGVNAPAVQPLMTFPFVANAYSGRNSNHSDPGCTTYPGNKCPVE
ncbi:MAG: DUF4331 domain-containing protein [Bryobacteraceae bacterium]